VATDIEQISTALAEFDKVSAGLTQLKQTYGGVLFDVEMPEGLAMAKAARAVPRQIRYDVENVRKSAKAPLLSLGKKLDSEAARIISAILEIETPIDQQIKTEEARKEREKQARELAERDRVCAINTRIGELRGAVPMVERYPMPAAQILEHIGDLERVQVDDSFAEFRQQAEDAKLATLSRLRQLHGDAVTREAEAAELAKLRAAQKERDDAAAANKAIAQAEVDRAARAEAERQAESNRLARIALEAEQAELARLMAAQNLAADEERRRLKTERDLFAAEQERLRIAALPKPKPARVKKPTAAEIIAVLAAHYGVSEQTVTGWLKSLELVAA
jgi:hypothetical protein